ncbi:GntR family transcriptional regulator [Pseudonocardia broussonetiae]|uniref:GntR family transcriptional regulator n=1 Tax=Pseudonocardia broussonetiae TaxID=2736640 RepID=A0A6M6JBF2_9PSEU|nr:GntR family transcriptional regulator [Pseudonocardia broussonetiae]QJY44473.1 GntR family transcriptional regulator [Pseudonocardia broussonetiae]
MSADPVVEPRPGRRLALDVHAAVRAMILSGELPPGEPILQAALARRLNVSRTPMREAFRLLQEEGLIDSEPDQRAVVRAVDPAELDAVYAERVLLESVAVSITVRSARPELVARLEESLALMRAQAGAGDVESWRETHREFHRLTTEGAPMLADALCTLGERADRFLRLAQFGTPVASSRWDADHGTLVDAYRTADHDLAVRTIAQHLARTAFTALADIAPCEDATATRAALKLLMAEG